MRELVGKMGVPTVAGYDMVRIGLGVLLLTAAALKGHQLATEPVAETGLLTSRWFLIGVVEFELFFGLCLLAGLYPFTSSAWGSCDGDLRRARGGWRPVLAFLMCIAVALSLAGTRRASIGELGLTVDPECLDFGEGWEGEILTHSLPLKNGSNDTIEIVDVRTSCACVVAEPRVFSIGPGATEHLRLEIDLTSRSRERAKQPYWDIRQDIVVVTRNAPPKACHWRLHGRVRRSWIVSPNCVRLGNQLARGSQIPKASFRIQCYEPCGELSASCSSGKIEAAISVLNDEERVFLVTVTVSEHASSVAGVIDEVVTVTGAKADAACSSPLRVRVLGTVVEDVKLSPEFVHFGPKALGDTAVAEVTISSRSGKSVSVESVEIPDDTVAVHRAPVSPAGTVTFRLVQRVVRPGEQSSIVRFAAKTAGSKEVVDATLRLAWYTYLPSAEVD